MSKELEALERIGQFKNPRYFSLKTDKSECKEWHFETIKELFPNDFDTIEKSLKALEIIKEHISIYEESIIPLGKSEVWHIYLNMKGYLDENHEEYDLLKEVLL